MYFKELVPALTTLASQHFNDSGLKWDLIGAEQQLHGILTKFNSLAYPEGEASNTRLSLGPPTLKQGRLRVPVVAHAKEIVRTIAVVAVG